MDIEYLREYLVVADRLNLTHAAEELNTTQSTLSKHMAAIERDLRCKVLRRSKAGVKLTQEGASFYRKAASIVSIYDEALNEAHELHLRRRVTIGGPISNGMVVSLLAKTAEILANRDGGQIAFVPMDGSLMFEQLQSGELDIILSQGVGDQGAGDWGAGDQGAGGAGGNGIASRLLLQQGAIPAGIPTDEARHSIDTADGGTAFELRAYYRSRDTERLSSLLAVLEEAGKQLEEADKQLAEARSHTVEEA